MSRSGRRLRISAEVDVTRGLLEAARFGATVGLDKQDCQALSTAVSELARNILKYAGDGFVLMEEVADQGRRGIQITVQDRGPGIRDIDEAMRDHASSGGTLGLGLPGVRRLMDDFEIESAPGSGTKVVIRKWAEGASASAELPVWRSNPAGGYLGPKSYPGDAGYLRIGVGGEGRERTVGGLDCAYFVRPCRGERMSGDLAIIREASGHVLLAVVDALGHGPGASRIARAAGAFLNETESKDPMRAVLGLHDTLQGTDGAAVSVCIFDVEARAIHCVSVGNTVIRVVGTDEKRAFSTPGTVGYQIRTPRHQHFSFAADDVLVMHSDGLKESFDLTDHPEMLSRNPGQLSRDIVMRFGKDYDDVSCLVARYAR